MENYVQKLFDFVKEESKFNVRIKNSLGAVVGTGFGNDTFEDLQPRLVSLLSRLSPGIYVLYAKAGKTNESSNAGYVQCSFTVPNAATNTPKNNIMDKEIISFLTQQIEQRVSMEYRLKDLEKKAERLDKYEKMLDKMLENDKAIFKMLTELADDDEDNDSAVFDTAKEAMSSVSDLASMFQNLKNPTNG